jgi:hypothetical protein
LQAELQVNDMLSDVRRRSGRSAGGGGISLPIFAVIEARTASSNVALPLERTSANALIVPPGARVTLTSARSALISSGPRPSPVTLNPERKKAMRRPRYCVAVGSCVRSWRSGMGLPSLDRADADAGGRSSLCVGEGTSISMAAEPAVGPLTGGSGVGAASGVVGLGLGLHATARRKREETIAAPGGAR